MTMSEILTMNVHVQNSGKIFYLQPTDPTTAGKLESAMLFGSIGYIGGSILAVDTSLSAICPAIFMGFYQYMGKVTEGINALAVKAQQSCGFKKPVVIEGVLKTISECVASYFLTHTVVNYAVPDMKLVQTGAHIFVPIGVCMATFGAVATLGARIFYLHHKAVEETTTQNIRSSQERKVGGLTVISDSGQIVLKLARNNG
jgi:hypothetical protein